MSETDSEELPYKVGDVVCRSNALKSPAKIVGIQLDPSDPHRVKLFVITAKKRFCEWEGRRWWFVDPMDQVSRFRSMANYYEERAKQIEDRIEAAKAVTP